MENEQQNALIGFTVSAVLLRYPKFLIRYSLAKF